MGSWRGEATGKCAEDDGAAADLETSRSEGTVTPIGTIRSGWTLQVPSVHVLALATVVGY